MNNKNFIAFSNNEERPNWTGATFSNAPAKSNTSPVLLLESLKKVYSEDIALKNDFEYTIKVFTDKEVAKLINEDTACL